MDSSYAPNYLQSLPDSTISFDYVPSRTLASSFQLKNTTSQKLAFSIKTNAPFAYLVKPRLGCINPQDSLLIHITMLPTKYDSQTPECSDKFLINACPISGPMTSSSQAAQKVVEALKTTPRNLIQQTKLTVKLKHESNETLHDMSVDTRDTSRCEESLISSSEELRLDAMPPASILAFLEKSSSEGEISDREAKSGKKESERKIVEKALVEEVVSKKECESGIEKKLQESFEKVKGTATTVENVTRPLEPYKVGMRSHLWIAAIVLLLSFVLGGMVKSR